MDKADFEEFAKCMATLQEIFTPDKSVSKQKIEIYFQLFSEWSIDKFQRACNNIMGIKKIPTFPLPAEIKDALYRGQNNRAIIALEKVEKAVDLYGQNYSLVFDDLIIHAVVHRLGGWVWLTTQNRDEWKWIRKDFEKYYNAYIEINPKYLDIPERLAGLCEINANAIWGIDINNDENYRNMIINLEDTKKLEYKQKQLDIGRAYQ